MCLYRILRGPRALVKAEAVPSIHLILAGLDKSFAGTDARALGVWCTLNDMSRTKRGTSQEAMELTTFKLRVPLAEFMAANAEVDVWLAKQRGFRLRRIAQEDDGTVIDMLLWDSVADGEAVAERLMEELGDAPLHAMIDHRTVRWRVLPVHHPRVTGRGRTQSH